MKRGQYKKRSLKDRIMAKVEFSTKSCWIWTGAIGTRGKPIIWITNVGHRSTRREIWAICRGKLPSGVKLKSTCKNKLCINPNHMVFLSPPETLDRFIIGSQNMIPLPESEIIDAEIIRERRANLRLWKEVSQGNVNILPTPIVQVLKELWVICDNKEEKINCIYA